MINIGDGPSGLVYYPGTGLPDKYQGHFFMCDFRGTPTKGFDGRGCRCTDGAIVTVVEGRGTAHIGEAAFAFSPHDVFVVPPWSPLRLLAQSECVLFSFSDRAAQEALGFWRESLD